VIAVATAGAVIALWARDDVLDSRGFVETTAPVVRHADVRDAVAELTVASLGAQPPAVQAQIRAGARELAASERFAQLWREANAAAHAQARALIRGDGDRVVLDVGALADLVVERLRASGVAVAPQDVDRSQTRVVVLDASEADGARDVASWAEGLALVLPGLAGGGLVALLLLARRRGLALAAVGATTALCTAIAAIALHDAEDGVTRSSGAHGVIERAYAHALTQPLRTDLRRGLWIALTVGCAGGAAAVQRLRR
jgi:hypothetical protein